MYIYVDVYTLAGYVYILFTCAYSLVSFYCFILGLGHGERKPGDFPPEWPCLPSRPRLKHQPGDPGTEGLGENVGSNEVRNSDMKLVNCGFLLA